MIKSDREATMITPGRTAMVHGYPSAPLKRAINLGWVTGTVLDFGCGKGCDVRYLREGWRHKPKPEMVQGARGYDPNGHGTWWLDLDPAPCTSWSEVKDKRFDTVILTYVLNTIEPAEQERVMARAWGLVKPGGNLVVSTRKYVNKIAKRKGWEPHLNGYWSNKKKGMFQTEVTDSAIKAYMEFPYERCRSLESCTAHYTGDFYLICFHKCIDNREDGITGNPEQHDKGMG